MDGIKVSEMIVRVAHEEGYRFAVSFDGKGYGPLTVDEAPPLGHDEGPNPARMLGAAIGHCLAASLVFCLGKRGVKVERGLDATVSLELVRTPEKRLRVGRVRVALDRPGAPRRPRGAPPSRTPCFDLGGATRRAATVPARRTPWSSPAPRRRRSAPSPA